MKLAIKYGLLITSVVVAWILITHFVFPVRPESTVNAIGPVLFNIAAILAIYLGIKSKRAGSDLSFKEGLKTGVSISLVYALSACIFFLVLFLLVGPTVMANEPMVQDYPLWQQALAAFAGLFLAQLRTRRTSRKEMTVE
jgi:hypothetical protein